MDTTRKELLDYVNKQIKTISSAKKFLSRASVDVSNYYKVDDNIFDYLSFAKQFVEEVASDSWVKITMDAINSFYFNRNRYA